MVFTLPTVKLQGTNNPINTVVMTYKAIGCIATIGLLSKFSPTEVAKSRCLLFFFLGKKELEKKNFAFSVSFYRFRQQNPMPF